jgi:hypothetical protein
MVVRLAPQQYISGRDGNASVLVRPQLPGGVAAKSVEVRAWRVRYDVPETAWRSCRRLFSWSSATAQHGVKAPFGRIRGWVLIGSPAYDTVLCAAAIET